MRVSGAIISLRGRAFWSAINVQREGSKAKPYQVRQVRKILAQYKLL
jgi:hypothetical protein